MNNAFKVAIVGGGASGLLCAVELLSGENALSGDEVVVLERNDRVGKKLISTGNGQGNLTNANVSLEKYHGDKGFVRAFFSVFKNGDLVEYLNKIGIFLSEGEDGKMYPASFQATSVLDIIRGYLMHKKCTIITDFCVTDVKNIEQKFIICSKTDKICANNVVCAFGGSAGKQYGTDGTSYSILENLGHKKTTLYPSLVQLKANLNELKGLKGIKEKVKIKALSNGEVLAFSEGDLLFTEYGISGSAVFNVSGYLQGVKNPSVSIEFLPNLSKCELVDILTEKEKMPHINREDLLLGLLNKQIGKIITKHYPSINEMVDRIKDYRIEITGNLGFNYAQVTKGGIDTNSVNPFTMQSKLVKNLYLIGELLDVDGDCGGYNLTFAFLSGIASGKNIKKLYSSER